jgi:hypothetical protein
MRTLSRTEAILALTNTDAFTRLPVTTYTAAASAVAAAEARGVCSKHGNFDMAYTVRRVPGGYEAEITDLGRAPRRDVAYPGLVADPAVRGPLGRGWFAGLAVEVLERAAGAGFPIVRIRYLASPATPSEWVAADAIVYPEVSK